jgi:putative PIN family toxin of toxin-antitoxin system
MRVTLDTNVIIAGLYSRNGASYQLLNMATVGELNYALTPLLALEYEGKVAEKIKSGFLKLTFDEKETVIHALIENAVLIERPYLLGPILKDAADNKVLECAVSGGCEVIVTFNKRHFPKKQLQEYQLLAMTPGEFYEKEVKPK